MIMVNAFLAGAERRLPWNWQRPMRMDMDGGQP
jgi:hypothetical protein